MLKINRWVVNLFLLAQGLFVSVIGSRVYLLALGYWVLKKTESTIVMGSLMAVSEVVRVVCSPIAGLLIDRYNTKCIIVLSDLFHGLAILIVAWLAFNNQLAVYHLFIVSVLSGICSAFFHPGIGTLFLEIVHRDRLYLANSVMRIVNSMSQILGIALGGYLYELWGAATLFLINGISFVFSSVSELFIKLEKIIKKRTHKNFFQELTAGYRFVWNNRGLFQLLVVTLALQFFAIMAMMLLLPFFYKTPGLDSSSYGLAMAFLLTGNLIGAVIMIKFQPPPEKRYKLFLIAALGMTSCPAFIPVFINMPVILTIALLGGIMQAIVQIIFQLTIQTIVPEDRRGRTFSFIELMINALTPIGMLIGGILAEIFPVGPLISILFLISFLIVFPVFFLKPCREALTFTPLQEEKVLRSLAE